MENHLKTRTLREDAGSYICGWHEKHLLYVSILHRLYMKLRAEERGGEAPHRYDCAFHDTRIFSRGGFFYWWLESHVEWYITDNGGGA